MREFHPLKVLNVERETPDSLRLRLILPPPLAEAFDFQPGQHIPIEADVDGKRLRRTYSLCSLPGDATLDIGIRIQPGGAFSGFAASHIAPGDELRVMPPTGRFFTTIEPSKRRHVLCVAAGSGITPILSILKAVLSGESGSSATLFYGNRNLRTTMFIEDLYALKNLYPGRLALHFLFSREAQEYEIMSGRLDSSKTEALYAAFCRDNPADDAYLCGPDTMIPAVTEALRRSGVAEANIHGERFGVPRGNRQRPSEAPSEAGGDVAVAVLMDGHRRTFTMHSDAENLVDAAALAGIELPYSCKGGVCATCRTHLAKGSVRMDANYGLEPWEVEKGFILACQSRPTSNELELDYDRT